MLPPINRDEIPVRQRIRPLRDFPTRIRRIFAPAYAAVSCDSSNMSRRHFRRRCMTTYSGSIRHTFEPYVRQSSRQPGRNARAIHGANLCRGRSSGKSYWGRYSETKVKAATPTSAAIAPTTKSKTTENSGDEGPILSLKNQLVYVRSTRSGIPTNVCRPQAGLRAAFRSSDGVRLGGESRLPVRASEVVSKRQTGTQGPPRRTPFPLLPRNTPLNCVPRAIRHPAESRRGPI